MKKYSFLLLLLFVFSMSLFGQTPTLRISNISNGQTNVSVSPVFNIVANMPFDMSKFKITPEASKIIDTSGIGGMSITSIETDSVTNVYDFAPNVLVIPEDVYLNSPDSTWDALSVLGTINLLNDTTIIYNCDRLNNYTKYYVILRDVYVLNGEQVSIPCETYTISFTTQKENFRLAGTSLGNGFVRCTDAINFQFNRKIDSLITYLGPIVEVVNVAEVNYEPDGTREEVLTTMPITSWFNEDSTMIYVSFENIPSQVYYARVNLNYLTGDENDRSMHQFTVNSKYTINMSTEGVSYQFQPYNTDAIVAETGETVNISAYTYFDNKMFEKWICPEDPAIMGSRDPNLTIIKNCTDITDLHLTAMYAEIPKDTIIVSPPMEVQCIINVFDGDGNFVGNEGTYYIDHVSDEQLRVVVIPDQSVRFTNWFSSVPQYNGSTDQHLIVKGGSSTNIVVRPEFGPPPPTSRYSLTVLVRFANDIDSRYTPAHLIRNFANVTPAMTQFDPAGIWMKTVIERDQPFGETVTINVLPDGCDCYRLYSYYIDEQQLFEHNFCSYNRGPYLLNYPPQDIIVDDERPQRIVVITLDRKIVTIETELVVENGHKLPKNYNDAYLKVTPDYPLDVTSCTHKMGRRILYERTDNYERISYALKCHQNVIVETKTNSGTYTFRQYNTSPGYFGGNTPTNPLLNLGIVCTNYSSPNSRIQAILSDEFRLTEIKFLQVDKNKVRTTVTKNVGLIKNSPNYDYDASGNEDPNYVFGLDATENTVILEFIFNKDVNQATVNNLTNIKIEDISDRIDYPITNGQNQKFYYYPHSSGGVSNFTWINPRTIRLVLKNPNFPGVKKLPKFEVFKISWNNSIRSTANDVLKNPNWVKVLSEYPTAHLTAYQFVAKSDIELDDIIWGAEFLAHAFVVNESNGVKTTKKEKYPNTIGDYYWITSMLFNGDYSVNALVNTLYIGSHKRASSYHYHYGMNWYEKDDGNINKTTEILNIYQTEYNKPNGGDKAMREGNLHNAMGQLSHNYRYNYIRILWWTIKYLSDDLVGHAPMYLGAGDQFDSYNRWGTAPAYNQLNDVTEHDGQFFRLKMRYELK